MASKVFMQSIKVAYTAYKDCTNDGDIKDRKNDELIHHEVIHQGPWETVLEHLELQNEEKGGVSLLEVCKKCGVPSPQILVLKMEAESILQNAGRVLGGWVQGSAGTVMGHICIIGLDDHHIEMLTSVMPLSYQRAIDMLAASGHFPVFLRSGNGSMVNAGTTVHATVIIVKSPHASAGSAPPGQDPDVAILFEMMDANKGGTVSKIEFVEFLRVHKPKAGSTWGNVAKLQAGFGLTNKSEIDMDAFQAGFKKCVGLKVTDFEGV
jgi:hypothetical protein